jgi:hypothetical protein
MNRAPGGWAASPQLILKYNEKLSLIRNEIKEKIDSASSAMLAIANELEPYFSELSILMSKAERPTALGRFFLSRYDFERLSLPQRNRIAELKGFISKRDGEKNLLKEKIRSLKILRSSCKNYDGPVRDFQISISLKSYFE